MKTYQKEITVSLVAVLAMILAIIAFFQTMNRGNTNGSAYIYRLIPPDAEAVLAINKPADFDRMILRDSAMSEIFATRIPDLFLSFLRNNRQAECMVLSFHPQGVVCYMWPANRLSASIQDGLREEYGTYPPLKMTGDGIEYTYYPGAQGRFFGCYTHGDTWVGSYSKKLLEKTANLHQQEESVLPAEMIKRIGLFDSKAPLNILFPTKGLDLAVLQDTISWQIEERWLSADLFFSNGNFCCFAALPYQPSVSMAMYEAMGDTTAQRISRLYPSISLSFETDSDAFFVYYTGCVPLPVGSADGR